MQPLAMITCPSRRPSEGTFPFGFSEAAGRDSIIRCTPDVAGRSDYAMNSGHAYSELGARTQTAMLQQALSWLDDSTELNCRQSSRMSC